MSTARNASIDETVDNRINALITELLVVRDKEVKGQRDSDLRQIRQMFGRLRTSTNNLKEILDTSLVWFDQALNKQNTATDDERDASEEVMQSVREEVRETPNAWPAEKTPDEASAASQVNELVSTGTSISVSPSTSLSRVLQPAIDDIVQNQHRKGPEVTSKFIQAIIRAMSQHVPQMIQEACQDMELQLAHTEPPTSTTNAAHNAEGGNDDTGKPSAPTMPQATRPPPLQLDYHASQSLSSGTATRMTPPNLDSSEGSVQISHSPPPSSSRLSTPLTHTPNVSPDEADADIEMTGSDSGEPSPSPVSDQAEMPKPIRRNPRRVLSPFGRSRLRRGRDSSTATGNVSRSRILLDFGPASSSFCDEETRKLLDKHCEICYKKSGYHSRWMGATDFSVLRCVFSTHKRGTVNDLETGGLSACEKCITSRRPCLVMTDEGPLALPLPGKFRGEATPDQPHYWIKPK